MLSKFYSIKYLYIMYIGFQQKLNTYLILLSLQFEIKSKQQLFKTDLKGEFSLYL